MYDLQVSSLHIFHGMHHLCSPEGLLGLSMCSSKLIFWLFLGLSKPLQGQSVQWTRSTPTNSDGYEDRIPSDMVGSLHIFLVGAYPKGIGGFFGLSPFERLGHKWPPKSTDSCNSDGYEDLSLPIWWAVSISSDGGCIPKGHWLVFGLSPFERLGHKWPRTSPDPC